MCQHSTPCTSCARGHGIFELCTVSPTRPGQSQSFFLGCCSCVYLELGHTCGSSKEAKQLPSSILPAQPRCLSPGLQAPNRNSESSRENQGLLRHESRQSTEDGASRTHPDKTLGMVDLSPREENDHTRRVATQAKESGQQIRQVSKTQEEKGLKIEQRGL